MSEIERQRQQAFLLSLGRREQGASLACRGDAAGQAASSAAWLSDALPRRRRGMQVYEANAGAAAESALGSIYPTVRALMGDESFAVMARVLWQAQPPQRGDLAQFGEGLPAFIAGSDQLVEVPYLADAARLDRLLAQAENAAEAQADASTLHLLGEADPQALRLDLAPGIALLDSAYPIVRLWQAHQGLSAVDDSGFAAFREALARGEGECALVWRQAWRAKVEAVDAATARWTLSLLQDASLAEALAQAGDEFAFEPWLLKALQQGWVLRARCVDAV